MEETKRIPEVSGETPQPPAPIFVPAYQNPPDCCTHERSDNRKFRLTFEKGNNDSLDDCEKETRYKCITFWNFIDSDPELSSLVKDGHFTHKNCPTKVATKDVSKGKETTRRKKVNLDADFKGRFGMTKAKMKALHEERRKAFQKQREKNTNLELKSGQLKFTQRFRNKKKDEPKPTLEFSDRYKEAVDETVREMNKFDINK